MRLSGECGCGAECNEHMIHDDVAFACTDISRYDPQTLSLRVLGQLLSVLIRATAARSPA